MIKDYTFLLMVILLGYIYAFIPLLIGLVKIPDSTEYINKSLCRTAFLTMVSLFLLFLNLPNNDSMFIQFISVILMIVIEQLFKHKIQVFIKGVKRSKEKEYLVDDRGGCLNCANTVQIGERDHACFEYDEPIIPISDYDATGSYFGCNGNKYVRRQTKSD